MQFFYFFLSHFTTNNCIEHDYVNAFIMMQFFYFFFSHFTTNCFEHDYVHGADRGAVNDPVGSTALYFGVVFDCLSV